MKLEPLKLQCWKCCSWQFFQKVEPLGFSEGKFCHSCLAKVKVEGKSNSVKRKVCLIPPQTKMVAKIPSLFLHSRIHRLGFWCVPHPGSNWPTAWKRPRPSPRGKTYSEGSKGSAWHQRWWYLESCGSVDMKLRSWATRADLVITSELFNSTPRNLAETFPWFSLGWGYFTLI